MFSRCTCAVILTILCALLSSYCVQEFGCPRCPLGKKVHFTVWQGRGLWHSAVTVSPFSATQQLTDPTKKNTETGAQDRFTQLNVSTYENKTGKGDIRHVFIAIRKRGQHKGIGSEPLLLLHVCMLHVRVRLGGI